jgi:uncharacterized protein YcbX
VIELTQINIYPVKSCKGTTLARCRLTEFGLLNDRRWMVVDAQNSFLSQRSLPRMSLIEPFVETGSLILKAPNARTLEIPFEADSRAPRSVRIWDDSCIAHDCGDEAAQWFTEVLETEARLVIRGDKFQRPLNTKYAVHGDQVGFADAFPLLLISSASLRDLNDRLDHPIPMNRFRPNLVVSGCDPYAEDRWRRLFIGDITVRVCKPCARCTVPTVNQSTGIAGKEPLTTLATYRKGSGEKVFFGQNLINEQKDGELVVGMEIKIEEQA